MKSVMTVELSVYKSMTPLVSGYLQAYALTDPAVSAEYRFDTYIRSVKTPPDEITRDLLSADADIYALSAYIWNFGLVRSLVKTIRQEKPRARVILGGPQVMHHALKYLDPHDEQVTICNGEGEVTFTEYLRELTESSPDLAKVPGLSFYRDRSLVNTEARARIKDLNTIPSPFLTGRIEPRCAVGLIETNRGCPYHCGFCFWGAATNDRVYQFDEARVRDELRWMARNGNIFIYIADANWGMLSRDVGLSEHIAECSRQYGMPNMIYFSAAKNKPHAVTNITAIFQEAGLVTSQPVSMQTLEPDSLKIIARQNIKLDAFRAVQKDLHERGLSSFNELIWPLPGETLDSFRNGVATLCEQDTDTIIAYSHLLLNNTPIYHNREALGLVTRPGGDSTADARIVIATQQVSPDEFGEGMRYFYAVHALHNTRSLRAVAKYLTSRGIARHTQLFASFADFWWTRSPDDPIAGLVERSIRDALFYDIGNYGLFIHTVLHEHRALFTRQLTEFVSAQPWWDDPAVRALFEVDLLGRPYVYSNTPLEDYDYPFEAVKLLRSEQRRRQIEVAPAWRALLASAIGLNADDQAGGAFEVGYKRLQYPYMAAQSLEHNSNYCFGMIERVQGMLPVWQAVPGPG
jgi:radical SAM superfamily enzyme YgiQ (UPF0313 family)